MRRTSSFYIIAVIIGSVITIFYYSSLPTVKWYSLKEAQEISKRTNKPIALMSFSDNFWSINYMDEVWNHISINSFSNRYIRFLNKNCLPVKYYINDRKITYPIELNSIADENKKRLYHSGSFADYNLNTDFLIRSENRQFFERWKKSHDLYNFSINVKWWRWR